jgi:hypothetical protein
VVLERDGGRGQVPEKKDALCVAPDSPMVMSFGGRPRFDSVTVDASPLVYGQLATG